MSAQGREAALARMERAGVSDLARAVFADHYTQVEADERGYLPEADLEPLDGAIRLRDLPSDAGALQAALAVTAVIKPNGGLGTSMGITGPKTALVARDGLTFVDIMARQVLAARARHDVRLPLLLMNSAHTQEQSLAALARYPELAVAGVPLDFLQSTEPKLRADNLLPVDWPADPELEWCPPGHGDIYVALQTSGVLETLRGQGFRYAFLANADNLGATPDPSIPAWMAAEGIPYVAEVCRRTVNDRKGGHLARRRRDGGLILRDNAQVAPGEEHWFQDETRHRYFHANNIWVDLDALAALLVERSGRLGLPLMVNRKTVDPRDPDSVPVLQLETAMGAAIGVMDGAQVVEVPRDRFRPVKTTAELLLVRSDLYRLTDDAAVAATTDREQPAIRLDPAYRLVDDFEARFPRGVPSLRDATSLTVRGDVRFGGGVVCRGDVLVGDPGRVIEVPDGAVLTGDPGTVSGGPQ